MKTLCTLAVLLLVSVTTAPAQQKIVIAGTLTGGDGKPMTKANLVLTQVGNRHLFKTGEVAKDGSYTMEIPSTGLFNLKFCGADHINNIVPLYVEKAGEGKLDVRLGSYDYNGNIKTVKIITDFKKESPLNAVAMDHQPDGTFTAEFDTKEEKFSYKLLGLEKTGRNINGTQSEDYLFDGDGDYKSVVTPRNGKVKIVFDPNKLVRSQAKAKTYFAETNSRMEKFAALFPEIQVPQKAYSEYLTAAKREGKDMNEAIQKYDQSSLLAPLAARIDTEQDSFSRQLLMLEYLSVKSKQKEARFARAALAEIAPESILWSIDAGLIRAAITLSGEPEKYHAYIEQVVAMNDNHEVKANMLYLQLVNATNDKQVDQMHAYFDRLQKEFSDTPIALAAKHAYNPYNVVKVGTMVPAFALPSLDDPKLVYSNESMKGKVYLLDFWATWCGPCVGELGNLHAAYDKFKGKNFEIISLSFDESPDAVKQFREKQWKMPWLHTFVPGGFTADLAKRFEVVGIPRPLLIDGEGRIVAAEADLRGEKLAQTLTRVLGGAK